MTGSGWIYITPRLLADDVRLTREVVSRVDGRYRLLTGRRITLSALTAQSMSVALADPSGWVAGARDDRASRTTWGVPRAALSVVWSQTLVDQVHALAEEEQRTVCGVIAAGLRHTLTPLVAALDAADAGDVEAQATVDAGLRSVAPDRRHVVAAGDRRRTRRALSTT